MDGGQEREERDELIARAAGAPAADPRRGGGPRGAAGQDVGRAAAAAAAVDGVLDAVGGTPRQWRCALVLGVANAADAVEVLSIGSIVTVFRDPVSGRRIDELPQWSGLLTSSVFAGMLVGGLAAGLVGDRVGRRPVLTAALVLNGSSALLSALAPLVRPLSLQVPWLVLFRVLGGLGVGGSVPSAFALAAELGPTRLRATFINIVACCWSAGVLFVSLAAWLLLGGGSGSGSGASEGGAAPASAGEQRWPWFVVVAALPALLGAWLSATQLEESPRLLWQQGRAAELRATMRRFVDSRPPPRDVAQAADRDALLLRIETDLADPACSGFVAPSAGAGAAAAARAGAAAVAALPRRRTLLLCSAFFFLSFAHYGVSAWVSDLFRKVKFTDPFATSLFYTLAAVPGLALAVCLLDVAGRRAVTATAMGVACLAAWLFALEVNDRAWVLAAAALFNAAAATAWNGIDVFSAELLPVRLRGTGLGLSIACGRVGSIAATVFNSFALAKAEAAGVATVLTGASAAMLAAALSVLLLPETKGSHEFD